MTDIMEQQPKASSTRQEREAAFDAHVESNLKRNYISHFLHGMLGLTGFRLIYAPTFIPAYVQMLTGSTVMVGLGQSLLQFGAIVSPLVAANRMETKDYVLPMSVRAGTLVRLQILGLALSGFFMSGMPLVVATFVFLFLMGIFQGMQRVAFALVMAKVIPISRRGRLQAWRNLVGGAIAALLSYSAGKYLIQHNVFGNGYATTFLAAFALTSLGLLALQFGMVEPRAPTVRIEEPLLQRLRQFPVLLEDRDYRNFVVAQGLAICARVSAPFYILYAQKLMPLSGETIGTLSLAYLGADTVTNLIWGHLGDKHGYRVSLIGVFMLWACSIALLFFAWSPEAIVMAFFGLGAAASGYVLAAGTIVLEFGLREDVPMRLAFVTTVEGIVSTIGPIFAGLLIGAVGFGPLLGLSLGFILISLMIMTFWVNEPRHRDRVEEMASLSSYD
jgi:MFS family permease